MQMISAAELAAKLKSGEPLDVLDVRRQVDLDSAPRKIPTAVWQDPQDVDRWRTAVPADREIVVYCVKGGGVSRSVAESLTPRNDRVYVLEGGIKAWITHGGHLE
jgi:rhodanese-related sulfurtransferase